MDCCSNKNIKTDENAKDLVECLMCGLKTVKSAAAIMYLKGEEYIFCSHECQDRWEIKNPKLLW